MIGSITFIFLFFTMTDNSQNPINKHTNTILDRLHKEYVYSCKVKFSIYLIMRVISSTRATYSFLNTSLGLVSLLIVYVYWASRLPCVWSSPCSKLSVHCGVSPVPVEHSEDVTNLILIIVIKGLHLSNYSQHVGQSCTELYKARATTLNTTISFVILPLFGLGLFSK